MEFHDDYPQYELMAHHSEEEGKKKRRKLWNVFWIMLIITLVELVIGFYVKELGLVDAMQYSTISLKFIFISLTIVKAFYIVMAFMHLGDEVKALKWVILAPYITFIVYLAVMATVGEGSYSQPNSRKNRMDKLLLDQNEKVRSGQGAHGHDAGHGGEEHGAEHGEKPAEGHH